MSADGDRLVKVAWARHQAEAEMLVGMLDDHGVPSLMRRAGGFDVPDYLAAGPRDILVPGHEEQRAREILAGPGVPAPSPSGESSRPVDARTVALVLVGIVAVTVLLGLAAAALV